MLHSGTLTTTFRILTPSGLSLAKALTENGPQHPVSSPLADTQRAGNVLMSYNNRPATDVIPFLSPLIAPSARVLGPALNAIAATPIRGTVEVCSCAC